MAEESDSMRKGKKISILGAGNVGASIAYTLTLSLIHISEPTRH